MCGIAGYFSPNAWLNTDNLEHMNRVQKHRGPDASGIFAEGLVGLSHCRLSIIDISQSANQPMVSHCRRYTMVYNGEVFNFQEIAQAIREIRPGFEPKTTSDSEIILEAFSIWGESFAHRLNGMFVIAIYDSQKQQLTIVRDRIGIKPLYYFYKDQKFAFASELKGLTKTEPIRNMLTLNPKAVSTFLHLGYIPAPLSIYNEISKLEAGSILTITPKGPVKKKWWDLSDNIESQTIDNPEEALATLESLLISSVRYRLISDVPFGTFLSGGIDSTIVTAVAQSISDHPINTFTLGFRNPAYNEAIHSKKIASFLGTRHHELYVSEEDALECLDPFFEAYDEPFADSSGIPSMLVARLARQSVTMALTGDGGDELFMGYGAYKWAKRMHYLHHTPIRNMLGTLLQMGDNRYQRAAKLFDFQNGQNLRSHIFSQEQCYFSESEIENLLFAQGPLVEVPKYATPAARKLNPAEFQALFDMYLYLPDDLLVKVDRATMAHGLEARVPLLDYRIVRFALNLDYNLKVKNGQSKWLLRTLLNKYIPPVLYEKPKRGFSIPLKQWLQADLKYLVDEYLSKEAIAKTGLIRFEAVQQLLFEFYNQRKDYLYHRVWALVVLQRWLIQNPVHIGLTYS